MVWEKPWVFSLPCLFLMCFNNNLKTAIHRYHIGTASLQKWTARVWFEKNHKFFSLPCLFLMCLITTWKQQRWQIWHRNSFFTKWTARVCFKINYEVSLLHEKTIFVQNQCLLIFTLTHGRLYRWTENSFPFFLYLKPVEISKKCFNTIWTSLKVV